MTPISETGGRRCARPRGTTLSCKGWTQEAALRMLMNNLDPRSPNARRSDRLRRHRQGGALVGLLRRHRPVARELESTKRS